MQGASKKQKDVCACVCVFHLGVVFVYLANLCIVGIQSSWTGTLCSDRDSKSKIVGVCVLLLVHMCLCMHVCLYVVYSEQLDCQTAV